LLPWAANRIKKNRRDAGDFFVSALKIFLVNGPLSMGCTSSLYTGLTTSSSAMITNMSLVDSVIGDGYARLLHDALPDRYIRPCNAVQATVDALLRLAHGIA
jgi:hypothetical protein